MFRYLFGLFAVSTVHSLSCISDTGQTTDSWFGLKEPLGSKYLYYDGEALAPSKHSMNDTTVGALANTVQQLWSPSTQYLIFNDDNKKNINKCFNFLTILFFVFFIQTIVLYEIKSYVCFSIKI
jgi:hypothetical protein